MENWQIAFINETRRRQEQIAEAEIDRMLKEANGKESGWQKAYQTMLLVLAGWLIEAGTRLQRRYTQLAASPVAGAEASPCSS